MKNLPILQGWQEISKRTLAGLLGVVLLFGIWGCGNRLDAAPPNPLTPESAPVATNALTEVATPDLITELRKELDQYQPQVQILSPRSDSILDSTTVAIQLKVNDLPLFKDPDLAMGPHVHLFIDDQPYRAVYDDSEPVIIEKLSPGSHTIRAFASRPWHESFKNEGAYAESTFHIFTKTDNNIPDFSQPLLTYSRPQGTYGAEPIMLDFYLTNAPLHFVAQENTDDNIADWRIRVTVNGESFILDNWQPVYLKGFKKGENWLKLEFIDEQGQLIDNVYNSPVRVIEYDPKVNDTLAKLVQNKLPLRTAKKLVTTKALPPEPATEIEAIEELEEEIIDLEPLTPEAEIIEEEPESPATDSEVGAPDMPVEPTEIQATETDPSTTPAEVGEPSEASEQAETVEAEIESALDELTEEAEELIDPNVDNRAATPEESLPTGAEPEAEIDINAPSSDAVLPEEGNINDAVTPEEGQEQDADSL